MEARELAAELMKRGKRRLDGGNNTDNTVTTERELRAQRSGIIQSKIIMNSSLLSLASALMAA